ncbi:MAG: hypothetical protein KDA92_26135, partial [Planctomycetales bacterium]|nr:hypothetical protein [Planctomycetales bacterium]
DDTEAVSPPEPSDVEAVTPVLRSLVNSYADNDDDTGVEETTTNQADNVPSFDEATEYADAEASDETELNEDAGDDTQFDAKPTGDVTEELAVDAPATATPSKYEFWSDRFASGLLPPRDTMSRDEQPTETTETSEPAAVTLPVAIENPADPAEDLSPDDQTDPAEPLTPELVITNPARYRTPILFLLNNQVITLQAGQSHRLTLAPSETAVLRYHRGGPPGREDQRSLGIGNFEFEVRRELGWNLTDSATPNATR